MKRIFIIRRIRPKRKRKFTKMDRAKIHARSMFKFRAARRYELQERLGMKVGGRD